MGLFAAMALLLVAIGIYEVISYSVSERSHELGLRMALGAQPRHVVRLVLGQAMKLSLLGVMIGVGRLGSERATHEKAGTRLIWHCVFPTRQLS